MWAFIRLIRASRFFLVIFCSYMLQLGLQRVFGARRMAKRWKKVHARNAKRLYRGFVRLRGVFIKMGQVLSIMGTFLPRVYTKELEKLQDEVPPQPYRKIAKSFEQSIGKSPEEAFASFAVEPIAAASLGQVHEAYTHEGDKVAVKVLYPNVATIIRVDLRVIGWALKVFRWFYPIGQINRVHEQLKDMLDRETNLEHEARCLERMAANFEDEEDVLFPDVYPDLSSECVLTMTFMEGAKISDVKALEEMGLDRYDVGTRLVQAFYKMLFFDKFFHADPHPGNFFVQASPEGKPRLVVLDFGAASEVTDNLVDGMLSILSGFMGRNDAMVVDGIETMGFVNDEGDRQLLEETVRKYFGKLLNLNITDFSNIGIDVAADLADPDLKRQELRALMRSIQYPVGWFFVERAVVILFGLSSQLAPKLNTVQVGFPYIMKFLAQHRLPPVPKKPAEPIHLDEVASEAEQAVVVARA